MDEEVCTDPNCLGCRMERLLHDLHEEGWPHTVVTEMFFDYLKYTYRKEAQIEVFIANNKDGTVH